MNFFKASKTSEYQSKDHDTYTLLVRNDETYSIYKNANAIENLDLEEIPLEIRESVKLEIERLRSNIRADKKQSGS